MNICIAVRQLDHGRDLPLPQYSTPGSAGMDLYAAMSVPMTLNPLERLLVPTGVAMAIPVGFEGQIRPRSGLALKHGITVLNAPGTVDADYRGEIKVILINFSSHPYRLEHGMRIAQLVISPCHRIEWKPNVILEKSERNSDGFGSTGY